MRLLTVRTAHGTRAARQEGDELVLLDTPNVRTLLQDADWRQAAGRDGERVLVEGAALDTVVPMPEKIICAGLNYHSHAAETGLEVPEHPAIFAKFGRSLIGPADDIVLPRNSVKVDWEAELAVVIGREVRHAGTVEAADAIAGYTVSNDVSMRDWQARTSEWLQGKTFEASTPVGPALVTLDELPDDLRLTCEVDGEQMQEASTSDLIFSPAEIVAYVSQVITLVPGDVVLTGTPGGIGARRRPPTFLQPGQILTTRIEGVGELVNRCVADPASS